MSNCYRFDFYLLKSDVCFKMQSPSKWILIIFHVSLPLCLTFYPKSLNSVAGWV